jgi:hypothetical protein
MESATPTVREVKHHIRVGATLDVQYGFAMTLEPGK